MQSVEERQYQRQSGSLYLLLLFMLGFRWVGGDGWIIRGSNCCFQSRRCLSLCSTLICIQITVVRRTSTGLLSRSPYAVSIWLSCLSVFSCHSWEGEPKAAKGVPSFLLSTGCGGLWTSQVTCWSTSDGGSILIPSSFRLQVPAAVLLLCRVLDILQWDQSIGECFGLWRGRCRPLVSWILLPHSFTLESFSPSLSFSQSWRLWAVSVLLLLRASALLCLLASLLQGTNCFGALLWNDVEWILRHRHITVWCL